MQCICGKELTGKQKYCSDACRKRAKRTKADTQPGHKSDIIETKSDTTSPSRTKSDTSVTTVTVAGQTLELGKPYSTDKDNRWAPNYDLSEEGFKRRNKAWDTHTRGHKDKLMSDGIRIHGEHMDRVVNNKASRQAVIQACEV